MAKLEVKPEPIVISDDSDDDLTSTESTLSQDDEMDVDEESSDHASSSSGRVKLDHQLRHVLNTIFPKRDDKNRAALKSAFELCSQLRDDYIVGRLLGSGSSGFVLSAKRVFDGREVRLLNSCGLFLFLCRSVLQKKTSDANNSYLFKIVACCNHSQ